MSYCPKCGSSVNSESRCSNCFSAPTGNYHRTPANPSFQPPMPTHSTMNYPYQSPSRSFGSRSKNYWIFLQIGTWFIIGSEFLSILVLGGIGQFNLSLAILGVLVMLIVGMYTEKKAWIIPMLIILLLDDIDESLSGYAFNILSNLTNLAFYISIESVLIYFWYSYIKNARL